MLERQPVFRKVYGHRSAIGGSQRADETPTELGLRFSSSEAGTISGIRFYKPETGVLTFTARLWVLGNTTALATASYTSDATTGWKQINFATPVPISAGTTYIASYHTLSNYFYAFNNPTVPWFPITNGPLTALGCSYNPVPGYPRYDIYG